MTREEKKRLLTEIEKQYKWLMTKSPTIYMMDIAFDAIRKAVRDEASKELEEPKISLDTYNQVAKERDIAIEQLHELGYEFGEKIETTKNDLVVDCTSKAAVIDAFGRWCSDDKNFEHPVWFVRDIISMPSITPLEPRWIPVSEKLPDDRDWYLGIFKEADTGWINPLPFVCAYMGIETMATTKEYWIIRGFSDRIERTDYYFNLECVAYMPLPKPYEAKEPTTKNDLEIVCQYTDEEISKAFIEDIEAVKDQLPKGQQMEFPDTFDEFAKDYGFKDEDEIYTNGSELIPVFRVKQWLAHMSTTKDDLGIDSISRKEVLQMIDNIREAGGFIGFNTYHEAFNQVSNMSSVPRWIPVSERLPEEAESVLVYAERNAYDDKGKFRKKVIDIGWQVDGRWHIDGCNGVDGVAWMPLPKPYKAESEAEDGNDS